MSSLPAPADHDADLVARSIAGSRDAFATIVARYQALVCSVAYGATGSLSQSEDVAQETFVVAWKQLRDLREPSLLRAWLCGIARTLVRGARRRARRDPARAAEPLEAAAATPAEGAHPAEQAIRREEEALLWRTLEQLPATYREPLILFYREQQSIERVASSLDLGEEVVRQRLARGRRALADQVRSFVEGTLARTAPGDGFTHAVMAALPPSVGAASVAGATASIGAGGAKSGALAKSAALVAAFAGFLGAAAGVLSAWLGLRNALDVARTPKERAFANRSWKILCGGSGVFALLAVALAWPPRFLAAHAAALVPAAAALTAIYSAWYLAALVRTLREQRRLRGEEERAHPEAFADARAGLVLRSRATLLGLPLWHVRLDVASAERPPVVAWIAIGDRAVGVLFAMGAFSVGGVSVGAASLGIVSVGQVSAGLVSMGGVSLGLIALGTVAAGGLVAGAIAFGWNAAAGALAVARDFAWGDVAMAAHANDLFAGVFFLRLHTEAAVRTLQVGTLVLVAAPLVWVARRIRRHARASSTPR